MDSTATLADPFADISDLFNLSPRTSPVVSLPTASDSGDCTNDGCTGSCKAWLGRPP